MTISSGNNIPRKHYTVSQGVTQTTFAVTFEFNSHTELLFYVDGTLTSLSSSEVSGGSGSTGTITKSVTGATGGSSVVILRNTALARTTDFPSTGAFDISQLNTDALKPSSGRISVMLETSGHVLGSPKGRLK